MPLARLTGEVARDAGHVAAHEPDGEGQLVVLEDVRHQVHVVGVLARLVRRRVEAARRRERKEHHLQKRRNQRGRLQIRQKESTFINVG